MEDFKDNNGLSWVHWEYYEYEVLSKLSYDIGPTYCLEVELMKFVHNKLI